MSRRAARTSIALLVTVACASPTPAPDRYRLGGAVQGWDVVGDDAVLADLEPRYPEFYAALFAPGRSVEQPAHDLRLDLEREPVTRRNYDALNTIAIAYFETNYRAETQRDSEGLGYLSTSFETAKLLAIPWRAYGEVSEPALRDAILDFFEDAASGRKPGSAATAPRVASIVSSLERKEQDPDRIERIRKISELSLRSRDPGP